MEECVAAEALAVVAVALAVVEDAAVGADLVDTIHAVESPVLATYLAVVIGAAALVATAVAESVVVEPDVVVQALAVTTPRAPFPDVAVWH